MNSFELALKTKQLPDKIEELVPMMFAGQAAVKFMAVKLQLINEKSLPDPLGRLGEQRRKTVEDGQCMGEMLLDVMARIGELSKDIVGAKRVKIEHRHSVNEDVLVPKYKKLGMKERYQLDQAQFINNHPELVKETIEECKKNEDIPNITTVLNKHKHARALAKEKERYDKAVKEGRTEKSGFEMTMEQREYLSKLEHIILILPKEPPKDWNQEFFNSAMGYVDVIIGRLEYFKKLIKE